MDMPVPDLVAEQNLQSWKEIVSFYEELDDPSWDWLSPLRRLVRVVAQSDRVSAFRAGQQLWELVISTAHKHGLQSGDPFVVVTVEPHHSPPMRVEYTNHAENVYDSCECTEAEAINFLNRALARLWADTR
jgi:hypothetical protein